MSFSAEWLALREPYDKRARNLEVLDAVLAAMRGRTALSVVDLACGSGSTLRTLSYRFPSSQRWRLADHDLGLLARAASLARPPSLLVEPFTVDLARDLEAALDGPIDLVTTSALLDLVSHDWMERFATECAARKLPVYAALTYDGLATLEPVDPMDDKVIEGVNAHQRTDKGFGPAVGPMAAAIATERFKVLGYDVTQGASDWIFTPKDAEIQNEIVTGWAMAAREIGALPIDDIVKWLGRRRNIIAAGRSAMRVGHIDFFAQPTATR